MDVVQSVVKGCNQCRQYLSSSVWARWSVRLRCLCVVSAYIIFMAGCCGVIIRNIIRIKHTQNQYNMHAARRPPPLFNPYYHIALHATGGISEPVELSVLFEGRWALRRVHCIEVVEVLTPNSSVIFGRAGLLGLHGRS